MSSIRWKRKPKIMHQNMDPFEAKTASLLVAVFFSVLIYQFYHSTQETKSKSRASNVQYSCYFRFDPAQMRLDFMWK